MRVREYDVLFKGIACRSRQLWPARPIRERTTSTALLETFVKQRARKFISPFHQLTDTRRAGTSMHYRNPFLRLFGHVLTCLSNHSMFTSEGQNKDNYNNGIVEKLTVVMDPESLAILLQCELSIGWFNKFPGYASPHLRGASYVQRAQEEALLIMKEEIDLYDQRKRHQFRRIPTNLQPLQRARLCYAEEIPKPSLDELRREEAALVAQQLVLQKMPPIADREQINHLVERLRSGDNLRVHSLKEIVRLVGAPIW